MTRRPEEPGGQDLASFGEALRQAAAGRGPGLFALVADHGEVVFTGSIGTADVQHPRPIRAVDRFRIASATKMFTAAVVLRLAAAGRLSLGDHAGDLLPPPVRALLPKAWPASVRQLLAMRSWAAGAVVSVPAEIARFMEALLSGDLLLPPALAQMREIQAASPSGREFGLGLCRVRLPDGTPIYGMGGTHPGANCLAFRSDAGRTVVMYQNSWDRVTGGLSTSNAFLVHAFASCPPPA
jgi:CubicO group peptidase (beta-lactamase class C family)